ncbi:MAG: GGDEF domain-containing protein, partial [Lachnospiraceae bacterium]|nr:GGDEF domain-containing protein [Lachnospiraceae bacterium]
MNNDLRYQVDYLTAMNKKLSDSEKMYRMVCDMSSCAYLYYSYKDGQITLLGNWQEFFPMDIRHIQDLERIFEYIEEEDAERLGEVIHRETPSTEKISCECKLRGKKRWLECETVVMPDEEGALASKVIKFRDISRFKQQNDELTYMAYYDMLTGLYNRNYFVGRLTEWLEKAKKEQSVVSVMFLDIDDFRKVNDGMGMIMGDELIQAFGQFLRELCSDYVM